VRNVKAALWHVRFWSKADICSAKRHVRFTPESGHGQCTSSCLLWAISGHSMSLIDYFIGAAKQRRRHGETEHSGGLRIDDQLKLVGFDNWQLRRLGALKDAANKATGLAKRTYNVGSIAYQTPDLYKVTHPIDGWQSIEC